MKKILFLLALVFPLFFGCADEDAQVLNNSVETIVFNAKNYQSDSSTRTALTDDLKFSWSDGDVVGIFPKNGDQIRFHITPGMGGTNLATFDGGGWALKTQETYYAYYPYSAANTVDQNNYLAIPISYTGQKQTGNKNRNHLAGYSYLFAQAVPEQGRVAFEFNHVSSLLHVVLNDIPEGKNMKQVVFSSDEEAFIQSALLDCSTGELSPVMRTESLTLDLENTVVGSNKELDVWMMCAPVDLSSCAIRIKAIDTDGVEYSISVPGRQLKSGMAYQISTNPDSTPYVRFESASSQSFKLSQNRLGTAPAIDGNLYYSVGDNPWNVVTVDKTIDFGGNLGDLRLRGKLPHGTARYSDSGSPGNFYQISFGQYSDVFCYGDIRTLVDYEDYQRQEGTEVSFWFLFENCYQLKSIPELHFRKLGKYCYGGLFRGCSRLVAPIDVIDVDEMDYLSCYSMFSKCSSLTKAPGLPCMNLSDACYQWMFGECTSLEEAPELPALELKGLCYGYMFNGATSLKHIKMMASSNLIWSNSNAFEQWTNGVARYGTFEYNSDAEWFDSNSSKIIPSGWEYKKVDTTPYITFTADSEQYLSVERNGNVYSLLYNYQYSVDEGKTWQRLNSSPEWIKFGGNLGSLKFRGESPNGTAIDKSNYLRFKFFLEDVPVKCSGDLRTMVDYTNYHKTSYSDARFCSLFQGCKPLVSTPELSLPEVYNAINASYCYYYMFAGCTSLVEAPELPASMYMNDYCYYGMFSACSNLKKAPALPMMRVSRYCYSMMFDNCRSLETAPALPATTLDVGCYEQMFSYCTSLKKKAEINSRVYSDYEDGFPKDWDKNMYYGCSALQ